MGWLKFWVHEDADPRFKEIIRKINATPPGEGFPLKVEPLEATMAYRTESMLRWLGKGPRPRYRPWLEWFREKILRMRPRWAPIMWPRG